MDLLFKGLTLVDGGKGFRRGDIFVSGGRITDPASCPVGDAVKIIDCTGMLAFQSVTDMHAHLRYPGKNPENIESATMSAVSGGITTVVAMPNTDPVCDSDAVYDDIMGVAEKEGHCRVIQAVAGTYGLMGGEAVSEDLFRRAGVVSDDGTSVDDAGVFAALLRRANSAGAVYLSHAEDVSLRGEGVINDSATARRLGLVPISNETEDARTKRDAETAFREDARLHFCHVSTRGSLDIIRKYKKAGAQITCEVTPHHFSLCDADILRDDAAFKMNPPLRSKDDVEAVIEAIMDGTVDAVATDHAPHDNMLKSKGFREAPFGIIGFETMIPLCIDVLNGVYGVSYTRIAELISEAPARILGLSAPTGFCIGSVADFAIVSLAEEWEYTHEDIVSNGKYTPFRGRLFRSRVKYTAAGGPVYDTERKVWYGTV